MSKAPIRELLFGRLALAEKLVTEEQLTECLGLQRRYEDYGGRVPMLGELLAMKGYLSTDQVRAILDGQRSRRDGLFGEIAMRWRLIGAQDLERALEIQHGMDAAGKPRSGLGEILVDLGLLRPSQVRVILGSQGKKIAGCPACRTHFNVVRFRTGARLPCSRCGADIVLGEGRSGVAEDASIGVADTLWAPPAEEPVPAPTILPPPVPATPAAPAASASPSAPTAPARERKKTAASAARPAGGAEGNEDMVEIRENPAGGYYYVDQSAGAGAAPRIGGYEVLSRLGSDGVSAVCKARRLEGGGLVALKVLRTEGAVDAKMQRAFREAGRKVVYLNHPNLKRVYEIGIDRGRIFLAEEFIEGQSLKRHLDTVGRMLPSDAMDAARQLAGALAYGHERDIVHGDVRPSNVVIDESGNARLSGLGVPKDAVLNLRYLGREASAIPFYLAPEVAVDPARADARSDVYSLGAVLYHMLTGRPPYSGSGSLEVLMRLAQESLVPPEQIDPRLPPELCRLVRAMLAPEPDDRPQGMNDVKNRLGGLIRSLSPLGAMEQARSEPDPEAPTQASSAARPAAARPGATRPPQAGHRRRAAVRTGKYRRRRRYGP